MRIINGMLGWFMQKRMLELHHSKNHPLPAQQKQFSYLLQNMKDTQIGNKFKLSSVQNYKDFANQVPVFTYEEYQPYIERARQGETDVFWKGKIQWFAKSSGTTNAQSKFIPITAESLNECHYKSGKDMFAEYFHHFPDTKIFEGKNLRLGGSNEIYKNYKTTYGDLSAIMIDNLPFWAEFVNTPNKKISLMAEWESKMKAIIEVVVNQDITSLTGVPSWMLVLLNNVLTKTQTSHLHAVWKNLEVFFHGGVSFKPYQEQYKNLMQQPINYFEIYNASEGFFAFQDQPDSNELLLLLSHGIFYEFIPMSEFYSENPTVITLENIEIDTNYALIITTNGGLLRYLIGDTIKFTSTNPYRIVVTGRTKHFINAFGEELMIENAEDALQYLQEGTDVRINEFTAGPVFMEGKEKGSHEWIIECANPPEDVQEFTQLLDEKLQSLNSDYQAKRYKNFTLNPPKVHIVPDGFFYEWMKENGKLGGQHKVPRLANNREYLTPLLEKIKK